MTSGGWAPGIRYTSRWVKGPTASSAHSFADGVGVVTFWIWVVLLATLIARGARFGGVAVAAAFWASMALFLASGTVLVAALMWIAIAEVREIGAGYTTLRTGRFVRARRMRAVVQVDPKTRMLVRMANEEILGRDEFLGRLSLIRSRTEGAKYWM